MVLIQIAARSVKGAVFSGAREANGDVSFSQTQFGIQLKLN
jgi:hypothetical protein